MKYPFNVELCVAKFAKTEEANEESIKFIRTYITLLNVIYNDGLNNPITVSIEEIFKSENCEVAFKQLFKTSYSKFLLQAQDAYKQGQADKSKNTTSFLKQSVLSVG